MFYHVKLTYEAHHHYWWNYTSLEEVTEELLVPFMNGQVILVKLGNVSGILNMKSVSLFRVYRTKYLLESKKEGTAPDEMIEADFEKFDCTEELTSRVRKSESGTHSTSLLQKTYATTVNQVFVIMKLGDKYLDSAYQGVIKPVIEEYGHRSLRIDEIQDSGKITDQVLQCIAESLYVQADLSGERPNCYYETGFAYALGKEVILTVRKGEVIHFDLAENRFIQWETEAELREGLRARFNSLKVSPRQSKSI